MRHDSNCRNVQHTNYQQFSRFLNEAHQARETPLVRRESTDNDSCSHHRPIAMVYGERQEWENLYTPEIGLTKGTIFDELNLPLNYTRCSDGKGGCRGW